MKKRMLSMVVTVALLLGCGAGQVFAADAKVTASLSADKKSVTSDYAAFKAARIYGYAYAISEHNIQYVSYGNNNYGEADNYEMGFICAPGTDCGMNFTSGYNLHRIEISGNENGKKVKGCIGYGYIE